MTAHERLIDSIGPFVRRLVSDYELSDALYDHVLLVSHVMDIAGAGVSVSNADGLSFVASSTDRIAVLERIQEGLQAGPCVDAYHAGEIVVIPDLPGVASRWPDLVRAADEAGLSTTMGVPMHLDGSGLGVLNLYDDRRDWSDDDHLLAAILADMATAYVANAHRIDRVLETTTQLQQALETRVIIEQAKGVIAVDQGITVDDAFEILRSHARSRRISLHAVAHDVVDQRLSPE